MSAGGVVAGSGGLLQTVERHVQEHGTDDSSNTMGNFCFEVSLSYRRLERLPRVMGGE
jgi:hypothetical protein